MLAETLLIEGICALKPVRRGNAVEVAFNMKMICLGDEAQIDRLRDEYRVDRFKRPIACVRGIATELLEGRAAKNGVHWFFSAPAGGLECAKVAH